MTWTELHDACVHQNTQAILERTRMNSDDAVLVDDHGSTPLHIACWGRPSVNVVQALIAAHPQAVMDQDVHGDTPLHVALSSADASVDVVKALLAACPTVVSVANREGLLPLHKACRYCAGNQEIIALLLDAYPYALRTRIKMGYPAPRKGSESSLERRKETDHFVLDMNPRSGLDMRFQALDAQLRDGAYPLHMAIASKAPLNVIEMITREEPDILGMVNKFGETPLHVALESQADKDIMDLLLSIPNGTCALEIAEIQHGDLPLHYAAMYGCSDVSVVHSLLSKDPSALQKPNKNGKLPLDLARECMQCSQDVLSILENHQ